MNLKPPPLAYFASQLCKTLLMAYILVMPWAAKLATSDIKPFDVSRMAEVLLMLLCALVCAWVAFSPRSNDSGHPHLIIGLGIALLIGALSTSQAAEPLWAIKEAGLWLGMAVIAALVCTFDKRSVDQLMVCMLISHLFYSLLNLIFATTGMALDGLAPAPEALTLGHENRRFFNHVQTISMPLVLFFFSNDPRRLVRWGAQLMFGSGLALLIATGGRASLLGIGLSTVLAIMYLLYLGATPKGTLKHVGGSYAWGALFYASIFLIAPHLWSVDINTHLSERVQDTHTGVLRIELAKIALEQMTNRPLLGIGPMQLAHLPNPIAAHPHNIYFQIGAEWGVVMLALFLWLGLWLVKVLLAKASSTDDYQKINSIAVAAALISMAVDACFSGNFVMPVSQVWIAVATGLALNAAKPGRQPTQNTRTQRHLARTYAVIALTGILATTYLTCMDIGQLDTIIDQSNKMGGPGREKPRYWSSGWF